MSYRAAASRKTFKRKLLFTKEISFKKEGAMDAVIFMAREMGKDTVS